VSSLKKFNAGTYLFREGEAPDAMYIVRSGALAVTKTKGSSEIVLAEIQVNGMVGEMALFDNKPRSANVKAIKDTEVVVLPYENLQSQMDQLPVWVKAIMKTLNENLRDANKKIRLLENPNQDEDRFPPHVINRLLSIINLVTYRFGKTVENQEGKSFSSVTLRNFTIQIFHEPTNKMTSMQTALVDLGLMKSEERGDGTQKLTITKPDTLLNLVDWYNDWLFKQEKDRLPPLTEEECRALKGLLVFAKKTEKDRNGKIKPPQNERH
jgi:CRP-like cAMP-binding protein